MRLGVLVNNYGIMSKLYSMPFNGKKALKLRKTIKAFDEEVRVYEEARNNYIEKHGTKNEKSGNFEIPKTDKKGNKTKEIEDFMQFINEMLDSEIADPDPVFLESEIIGMELSVEEIDKMDVLQLIEWKEEEKPKEKKKKKSGGE